MCFRTRLYLFLSVAFSLPDSSNVTSWSDPEAAVPSRPLGEEVTEQKISKGAR